MAESAAREQNHRNGKARNQIHGHLTQETTGISPERPALPCLLRGHQACSPKGQANTSLAEVANSGLDNKCFSKSLSSLQFFSFLCNHSWNYSWRTNLSKTLEAPGRSPKEDKPKLEMFILFQMTFCFSFSRKKTFFRDREVEQN